MSAPLSSSSATSSFALDANALAALKLQTRDAPEKSLKQAATQFEAVFMNMLMKSMRETVSQDGMFDSDAQRQYTSMLDSQMAQSLSGQGASGAGGGIGLADMIVKQLSKKITTADGLAVTAPGHLQGKGAAGATDGAATDKPTFQLKGRDLLRKLSAAADSIQANTAVATAPDTSPQAENFVKQMLPHAREAEAATGVPARFVLAQAALESGWGRSEVRGADGSASNNLFGIKAGRDWKGATVSAMTTEYVNGVAQKVMQKFRAYSSYAESFSDYAKLLTGSARYRNVLAQGQDAAGFANALQQAGYATDPRYAEKISRILSTNMRGVA